MHDKMKSSLRDPSLDTEEKCLLHATLQKRINQEEHNLHQSIWDNLATKMCYEDENAASKFWAHSVKEKKPRDTIVELQTMDSSDNQPVYEAQSKDGQPCKSLL